MTTYFLSDRYGSREEFQAPNDDVAVEVAERLLADWFRYEDRSRTMWLHASLHRLTGVGEDADEDADDDGWVDLGGITVTLDPVEPPCTDERGHYYDHGDVWGSGGGVAWTDTCRRCGLQYHRNTWAQDNETGQQGLTEERYEVAERWTADGEEEE